MNKSPANNEQGKSFWLVIFCLVISGEIIFSLPFHIPRYFRPTVLEVLGLSNADLGDLFAVYGVLAMLSYFPGGVLADHFSARKLMAFSLLATGIGGLFLAQLPGRSALGFLFGYFGITSILLFWAAMIRTTREWGGAPAQGRAFGLLDGGRGLVAAAAASVAALLFSTLLPANAVDISDQERDRALQAVIYLYTSMTLATAVLVWFLVPDGHRDRYEQTKHSLTGVRNVLSRSAIWWQALIVICAYCGYKGLDNYGLYAVDVLAMDEVESARFTSIAAYLRPVAAIAAGFIVDRLSGTRVITNAFLILAIGYALLSSLQPDDITRSVIFGNLLITFVGVFAIRGVYFALLEETHITESYTGTAVGLISVIGFTPDIFFAPISGRILDASPGIEGYHHYFILLTFTAVTGMVATIMLTGGKKK